MVAGLCGGGKRRVAHIAEETWLHSTQKSIGNLVAITTSSILYDSVISNFLDIFLLVNYELFSLVYQKRRIDGKFFRIRPVTCPAFGVRWGRCLLSVYGERYSHDRHTSLLISATHILTQQQTSSRQSKQSPIMLKLSKVTKKDKIKYSTKERQLRKLPS